MRLRRVPPPEVGNAGIEERVQELRVDRLARHDAARVVLAPRRAPPPPAQRQERTRERRRVVRVAEAEGKTIHDQFTLGKSQRDSRNPPSMPNKFDNQKNNGLLSFSVTSARQLQSNPFN